MVAETFDFDWDDDEYDPNDLLPVGDLSLIDNEKIKFLRKIPQYKQKSKSWLKQRRKNLTSSDGATALGINPYEKDLSVLFKKCGLGPGFTGNDATKHGERYESEAIDLYCKLMNKRNYEFGLISYDSLKEIRTSSKLDLIKNTNFIAGSPDGVAEDLDGLEDLILIEVKCPPRRKIIYGKIPDYYYPQVQLNMAIFDLKKADFIEYTPKGVAPLYLKEPMINIVRIHRDDDWLHKTINTLHAFWSEVILWRETGIHLHPEYEKMMLVINKEKEKNLAKSSETKEQKELKILAFYKLSAKKEPKKESKKEPKKTSVKDSTSSKKKSSAKDSKNSESPKSPEKKSSEKSPSVFVEDSDDDCVTAGSTLNCDPNTIFRDDSDSEDE
jgi:putative phage-type endonuclease